MMDIRRLQRAFVRPQPRDWLEALGLFGVFAGFATFVGLGSGLLKFEPQIGPSFLAIALIAVLIPALGEELVFRVLLQPRPACHPSSPLTGEVSRAPRETEGVEQHNHPSRPSGPPSPSGEKMRVTSGRSFAFWLQLAVSLTLFVIWHPVQVWLGLPMAQPVFLDLRFLAIATALGVVCSISWQRSGSIWPAIVIHWLAVVGWKAFLA